MKKDDQVYFRLQKHLDRQAVGFPATSSGAEIRILKHIFTAREAEIATCLSFRFETLETLFQKASNMVSSREELEQHLENILEKGGIETRTIDGERVYCNSPLVVGMYEMQLERLTPEFIRDFREYTSDLKFGLDFLGTELPQMRTIPVSRSIQIQHNVSTYDEVTSLVEAAEGPLCHHGVHLPGKKIPRRSSLQGDTESRDLPRDGRGRPVSSGKQPRPGDQPGGSP